MNFRRWKSVGSAFESQPEAFCGRLHREASTSMLLLPYFFAAPRFVQRDSRANPETLPPRMSQQKACKREKLLAHSSLSVCWKSSFDSHGRARIFLLLKSNKFFIFLLDKKEKFFHFPFAVEFIRKEEKVWKFISNRRRLCKASEVHDSANTINERKPSPSVTIKIRQEIFILDSQGYPSSEKAFAFQSESQILRKQNSSNGEQKRKYFRRFSHCE